MAHPLWVVSFIKRIYPGRFAVAKATHVPLIGRIIDRWLFEGDDLMFLPSDRAVKKIHIDQTIDKPDDMVMPSEVVDHFIDQARYHWIMNFCICRTAEGCTDYPQELGCLFLGETAMSINPKIGQRVTKEEAREHVRRCREAGLVHFVGRNKLDTVWMGVGPGDKLLTICNCCPCCCLWRVLPHLTSEIEAKFTRMPGVSVSVNDQCTGCGDCLQGVCFVDAIDLEDGRAVIGDMCKGCGRCVEVCPNGAIEISIDFDLYVDRSIARLDRLVDLL